METKKENHVMSRLNFHSVSLIALLAASNSAALGTPIASIAVHASVSITNVGLNRWNIVIQQTASGSSAIVIEGDPADQIALIEAQINTVAGANTMAIQVIGKNGNPGVASVERIRRIADANDMLRISDFDIQGDLGVSGGSNNFIEANRIDLMEVGGNWYSDVRILPKTPSETAPLNSVTVGGDWIGGNLYNDTGNIGTVAILGDMLPDGAATSEIWASTSISSVTAASMTQTLIGDNRAGFTGNSFVGTLHCLGDFVSTLDMKVNRIDTLSVDGTLDGNIEYISTLPSSRRIFIGDSLASGAEIKLPANGLAGRIIINNADVSGAWAGSVNVGGTTLAADYANTAASLGGGSAGTVPFDLHGTDSTPLDGASVAYGSQPGPNDPIQIRLYGPLSFASGERPVTITAESSHTTGEIDQTTCIIYTVGEVSRDANTTILNITPNFALLSGYTYRVRPVLSGAAVMNCDITSPVPVADWEYDFCVGTTEAADITGDGAVNTADFNVLALNYGHMGCPVDGDLNGDGNVNSADFNILAGLFGMSGFLTCSTSEEAMAAAQAESASRGMNRIAEAMEEMGFASVADFSDWLDTVSEEDQLSALLEVLSRLGE